MHRLNKFSGTLAWISETAPNSSNTVIARPKDREFMPLDMMTGTKDHENSVAVTLLSILLFKFWKSDQNWGSYAHFLSSRFTPWIPLQDSVVQKIATTREVTKLAIFSTSWKLIAPQYLDGSICWGRYLHVELWHNMSHSDGMIF